MELKDLGLQRINLDLSNNITENFFAKEGDIGTRGLSIKVLNNSVEIDTTGVSVTMYARVGQEVYSVDATVKDALKGEYELIYPTSILKSGIVYAELQLKKLDNIISTKKFKILVESGIVTDSAIEGHDSYPIFEQLLEAGANEEVRVSNEQTRITDEEERISNESERISNESTRQSNEDTRITDEDERDNGELERASNESTRIADEISRVENESTRQQNESTRQQNEVTRIANEEIRKLNEITRESNEEIRKLNEIARDDAESLRGVRLDELETGFTAHKEEYMQQKQLPHFCHTAQEYINLDQFWNSLRDGRVYTTEFNQFSVSPSPNGTKLDDNAGLVMEPSTNTIAGRDDYSKIGLFKPIEVNAYVDENDDYHVVAMQGDGRFKRDGTMGDVYVMNMVGYQKMYSDENVWGISYSDTAYGGFEVLSEAIKPDGTIRPYLLHAKYVAGRNPHESNNLASISGVPAEYSGMSHNGQIAEFKKKGVQYSGKTSHDDYYVQLMMWLKYANMSSDNVMKGCQSYYLRYDNLVAETNAKRVVVTNAQGNALLVGSTVDITGGCTRANITSIEDLGDGNSAVYVDAETPFNTTLSTKIETYPWNSGSCDNVLGVDGSPTSFTSGKEPFIINGIEMVVGGYEVLQNVIILNNATDNRIDAYINYDCLTYATSITSDYQLVGQISNTGPSWRYGSKVSISDQHPSLIMTTETNGSSTTGTGDGIYTNNPSDGGLRVWLSLGDLGFGARVGLRCLLALYSLADSSWSFLGRLSATGRSRRHAGVN